MTSNRPFMPGSDPTPYFQWLAYVPHQVRQATKWKESFSFPVPERAVVLLYSGPQDQHSLEVAIHGEAPGITPSLVPIDTKRDGCTDKHDMLSDEPYFSLCTAAAAGSVIFVGGGPNCRTWSVCRLTPPGPPQVRGRDDKSAWGLKDIPPEERIKCDQDNILLARLMYLWSLAQEGRKSQVFGFIEHPSDPSWASAHKLARQAPSIWAMEAVFHWACSLGLVYFHFDQCMFGQVARKATTIASNLSLSPMQDNYCNHSSHPSNVNIRSDDLSRYPWKMMQVLATAIVEKLVPVIAQEIMSTSTGDRVPAPLSGPVNPFSDQRVCALQTCSDPTRLSGLVVCRRCNLSFHAQCLRKHNDTRHERRLSRRQDRPDGQGPTSQQDRQSGQEHMTTPNRSDRPTVRPVHHRLTQPDSQASEVLVTIGFKTRPLRDGAGKPSPGRFLPAERKENPLSQKGTNILSYARECHMSLAQSLARKDKAHPFTDKDIRTVQTILDPVNQHTIHEGQPFLLSLISFVAQEGQDVDWEYPLLVGDGVPLGVEEPTLLSPGVWPTKDELRGSHSEDDPPPPPEGHSNYFSANQHMDEIRKTFEEERDLDMVEGPFTAQQAASRCGCSQQELCPGPLGAVDELDKVRTIYDGSIGYQNLHIQQNTVERTTAPTVNDCLHVLHWLHWSRQHKPSGDSVPVHPWHHPDGSTSWLLLKADVSKAHRRIKVSRPGWRFQVAMLDGEYWINKVGTYGMASAQLYWGRMAALLLRLLYALFPQIDWQFVYVDDFAWLIRTEESTIMSTAILLTLISLGVPLSWKKTAIGPVNVWLGFLLNLSKPTVQMAPEKHTLVLVALERVVSGITHTRKELERLLGRLQWATCCCPASRPFLQPLWAWKSAVTSAGRPSKLVRQICLWLVHMLSHTHTSLSPFLPMSKWYGSSDARADESTAEIGGWLTATYPPKREDVWWYSWKMTREQHPWAFDTGKPQQRIAALEMYASLMLCKSLLGKLSQEETVSLFLPLWTDNQGNAYALLNSNSKKWPCSAILMELLWSVHSHNMVLGAQHIYRELNQWADDLSNGDLSGFTLNRRLQQDTVESTLTLLPQLLSAGVTGSPSNLKKPSSATGSLMRSNEQT